MSILVVQLTSHHSPTCGITVGSNDAKYRPTLLGISSGCAPAAAATLASVLAVSPSLLKLAMALAALPGSARSLATSISALFTRLSAFTPSASI